MEESSPSPSPSPSSSSPPSKRKKMSESGWGSMTDDIWHDILKRLPARSLASAACVCKSWNQIANRILSHPKLASVVSFDPSPLRALEEVVEKVLSEPIRPHFVIASVDGRTLTEGQALDFLSGKLGFQTPMIVSIASGVMGRDAVTDEYREVMWKDDDDGNGAEEEKGLWYSFDSRISTWNQSRCNFAEANNAAQVAMVDKFVMDIKNFTESASGCTSPVGIIMFGNANLDQKLIVGKLGLNIYPDTDKFTSHLLHGPDFGIFDYAMPPETVIVGDKGAQFIYRSGIGSRNAAGAIALVFARQRDRPYGIGEIEFHAGLSKGVSAIGPRYKAVSVKGSDYDTWLTARREGHGEILDGEMILNHIYDELGNRIDCPDLYIGNTKPRIYSIGSEKSRLITSLDFHAVTGGNEEYLFVDGFGIKTGDYFQFYHSDPSVASSSCNDVSGSLRNLKLDWSSGNRFHSNVRANNVGRKEVSGGFTFSCCSRGESFFGRHNIDGSPFLENFPGVPLSGIFCSGEIGRGFSILNEHESQYEGTISCCLHVYSSVYLLMSYSPATLDC